MAHFLPPIIVLFQLMSQSLLSQPDTYGSSASIVPALTCALTSGIWTFATSGDFPAAALFRSCCGICVDGLTCTSTCMSGYAFAKAFRFFARALPRGDPSLGCTKSRYVMVTAGELRAATGAIAPSSTVPAVTLMNRRLIILPAIDDSLPARRLIGPNPRPNITRVPQWDKTEDTS